MQVRMKAAEILNPDKINQFLKLGDTIEFAGQAAPKGTRLRSNCWRRKSMLDKARSSVALRALPEQNDRIEPAADPAADPDVHRNRNHRAARIPAASVRQQVHRRRCGSAWHGTCLACENPISVKRLQAVPWAELCLHCQERSDLTAAGVLGADHEEGVELGVG